MIKAGKELEACSNEVLRAAAPEDSKGANIDPDATKKLIDTVRSLATATSQLVSSAAELATKPKDQIAGTQLSAAAKVETDAIGDLLRACSALQPGTAEVDDAIESIQQSIGDIDAAAISVAVGNFEKVDTTKSHQQCQEELVNYSKVKNTRSMIEIGTIDDRNRNDRFVLAAKLAAKTKRHSYFDHR